MSISLAIVMQGLSAGKLIAEAAAVDAVDAVGFNCGVGPGHMEQMIRRIHLNHGKYNIALPNAGYPKRIHNRLEFADNRGYFFKESGRTGIYGNGYCGRLLRHKSVLYFKIDGNAGHGPETGSVGRGFETREVSGVRPGGFFRSPDGAPKQKS